MQSPNKMKRLDDHQLMLIKCKAQMKSVSIDNTKMKPMSYID